MLLQGLSILIGFAFVGTLFFRSRVKCRRFFDSGPIGQVRFKETWASGRSLKNVATRFGGANRCLEVMIFDDELWIRLMKPFRLLFTGAEYDLLHRIPLGEIRSVKQVRPFLRQEIELEYVDQAGESHRLQLDLVDQDEFLELIPLRSESAEHSLLRPAGAGPDEEVLLRSAGSGDVSDESTLLRAGGQKEEQIPRKKRLGMTARHILRRIATGRIPAVPAT